MEPLEFLGLGDLHFETESYDQVFWCLGRRAFDLCQIDSSPNAPSSSMYQSGIYLFALLAFIITSTPIYFLESDCIDCLAEKIVMWMKNGGQLPF